MTPETALQTALVVRLLADSRLAALVGARVHDEVPDAQAGGDYVHLGPVNRTRFEACRSTWTIRMRWFAESTAYGRVQAWEIADAVAEALDGFSPVLAPPFACEEPIRVTQAGDVIDPLEPKAVFVDIQTTVSKGS